MSSTMAMFVPQWPSADDANADDSSNLANTDNDNSNDTVKCENMNGPMNGTSSDSETNDNDGAAPAGSEAASTSNTNNAQSSSDNNNNNNNDDDDASNSSDTNNGDHDGIDGIELTHDPMTGNISVSSSSDSGDIEDADNAAEETADYQCQLWSKTSSSGEENNNESQAQADHDEEHHGVEVNADPSAFGDIWSTEAFAFHVASPLKDLLDSGDFSLTDLLAQDELLQELRGCEARLVEHFGKEEIVAGLVECLMVEVPEGSRESWCAEEEARRERLLKEEEDRRSKNRLTVDIDASVAGDIGRTPSATVMDASSPTKEDPMVEAKWNSPPTYTRQNNSSRPPPGGWMPSSPPPKEEVKKEEDLSRSPGEEYDLRFIRYPYMACEVLCSEVGNTLEVLVDGYVDDVIHDEEDSLLGNSMREGQGELKEVKMVDEDLDSIKTPDVSGADAVASIIAGATFNLAPATMSLQLPPRLPLRHVQPQMTQAPPSSPVIVAAPSKILPKRRILDLLFSVLINAPPSTLDDRRGGYFEKILNVLFRNRSQAMCDYMNTTLIVTSESTGMAHEILGKSVGGGVKQQGEDAAAMEGTANNNEGESATNTSGDMVKSTSYVSLSQTIKSNGSMEEDNGNSADTDRICKFPSPDAPPMLMCALFDHLHSYSIMHIVQRLLLPSPARQQHKDAKAESDSTPLSPNNNNDETMAEEEEDNSQSAINNQFMNALNQMNGPPVPEEEDEDMEEDDPMNHIFQCTWSDSPNYAMELLLKRLEGDTSSFLRGYGFPVGYDVSSKEENEGVVTNNDDGNDEEMSKGESREEEAEAALLCSQHASEILIAIIQHSSLDSPVVNSLSTEPSLRRIMDLVMPLLPESPEASVESLPEFVAHESAMTCAITVLESLVLQLGGYGAVASAAGNAANGEGGDTTMGRETGGDGRQPSLLSEIDGPHTPPSATDVKTLSMPPLMDDPFANSSALLQHVPALLERLSTLLTHPVTQSWTVPAQYSDDARPSRPLLGTSRLRILRLIESLVLLGDAEVDALLLDSDVLEKALDLFWQFEWCSMLHQSVANLLVHVLEGGEGRCELQKYFLGRCRLFERLMGSFESEVVVGEISAVDAGGDAFVAESASSLGAGNEEKMGSSDNNMSDENDATSPRYGEMMLAMKSVYSEKGPSSSMESEDGSMEDSAGDNNAQTDEDDAVAPVSEDDVDSAMEKECQDNGEPMIGMSTEDDDAPEDNDALIEAKEDKPTHLVTNNSSASSDDNEIKCVIPAQATFRKGYMGHVIIICQALVHACNANTAPEETNDPNADESNVDEDDGSPPIEQSNSPLSSSSLDEICTTASFETSAILSSHDAHQQQDDSSSCGKKRKDRSPVRDGTNDIKRLATPPASSDGDLFASPASPIPKVPSSPTHAAQTSDVAQSPNNEGAIDSTGADNAQKESLSMDHILKNHPVYNRWQNFVTSVLAGEMSVQSTPLGGNQQQQQAHQTPESPVMNGNDLQAHIMASINDNYDNDFLCTAEQSGPSSCIIGSGTIGGMIVGEIDMDENDLDIAASMMEALSLPNNGGGNAQDGMSSQSGHGSHRRRQRGRGVIAGGDASLLGTPLGNESAATGSENGSSSGGIGNFGSVIQQPGGFKDYIYDDPLGRVHPFDSNEDSSDEEEETKNSGSNKDESEEDGFMSDAMVVSRDGGVSKQGIDGDSKNNGSIQKSGSSSSDDLGDEDDDDDDDDDDVPVMDLFAGSYEANFANFDAFDDATANNDNPFGNEKTNGSSRDIDAFDNVTSSTDNPFGNEKTNESSSDTGDDDFFAAMSSTKANENDDAFEFAKTPFDLVDTLSNDTEDQEGEEANDNGKTKEKGWS